LVKVEVNHVFRGTMLPLQVRSLTPESRRLFTTEVHVPVLATAELYGSKLVAALHRQHPRDLFDVHCLFETGGITDEMVECFVGYLAGHHRPLHEVLASRDHDLTSAYENEFNGMARMPVALEALIESRDRLRRELDARLTANHRRIIANIPSGDESLYLYITDGEQTEWWRCNKHFQVKDAIVHLLNQRDDKKESWISFSTGRIMRPEISEL
jgi:hypothetical protein